MFMVLHINGLNYNKHSANERVNPLTLNYTFNLRDLNTLCIIRVIIPCYITCLLGHIYMALHA